MAKRGTLKAAKATCAAYGMSLRHRDREYRVNFIGGSEATAYYTNDRADAVGTCRAMAVNNKTWDTRNERRKRFLAGYRRRR